MADARENLSGESSPLRIGQIVFFSVVVALGCGLWYGTNAMMRRAAAARIPPVPQLSGATAPELEQIVQAHALACRHPTSGAYVGALGRAYHANSRSAAARAIYELAVELEPEQWRWRYLLVLLDEEIGATEAALNGLREVVALESKYPPAWFRLGEAAFSAGLDDEADQAFRKMAELTDRPWPRAERDPFFSVDAYAAFGRARVAFRQGRFGDVEGLLVPALKRTITFGPGHRLLGRAYEKLGRADRAQRHLEVALLCAPYTPPVDPIVDELTMISSSVTFLTREAGVAFNKGDVNWAERVLRRARQIHPDDEDVLGELALLLVRLERMEEARPALERFLAMPPTHHSTASKIGTELVRQGHLEEAIACLERAVEIQPGHAPNQLNLGMALARSGNIEEAEALFREALRLDPYSHLARRNLATALYDQRRYEEAIEAYAAALELKEDDAEAHHRMGMAQQITQQLDAAEQSFRHALADDPLHAPSLDSLARLLSALGRHEEALQFARQLTAAHANAAQAHETLALVARAAGDLELARQECEAALRIDPDHRPARHLLDELNRPGGRENAQPGDSDDRPPPGGGPEGSPTAAGGH